MVFAKWTTSRSTREKLYRIYMLSENVRIVLGYHLYSRNIENGNKYFCALYSPKITRLAANGNSLLNFATPNSEYDPTGLDLQSNSPCYLVHCVHFQIYGERFLYSRKVHVQPWVSFLQKKDLRTGGIYNCKNKKLIHAIQLSACNFIQHLYFQNDIFRDKW
jgi:hypothetical protein